MRKPARGAAALLTAFALTSASLTGPATFASPPPSRDVGDRIDLPAGWQPEGVTTDGEDLYVGSLADGRLLRADLVTGRTTVLPKSATGKPAVGVDYDRWRKLLWVAGGGSGEIRAHAVSNGRLLATYTLPKPEGRFVNDLVVTRRAVYATDSLRQQLGVVRIADDVIPPSGNAKLKRLRGDIVYEEGFNANGIVKSGRWLILVQSNTGTLFRVNKHTGRARAIAAGGATFSFGDGIEPDGRRGLHVVRNQENEVVTVRLSPRRLRATVIARQTDSDFDVPTTVADVGADLWAVNARFGTDPGATTEYWLTRLDDPTP